MINTVSASAAPARQVPMSPDKKQSGFLVSVALAAVLGAAVIVGSLALEQMTKLSAIMVNSVTQ